MPGFYDKYQHLFSEDEQVPSFNSRSRYKRDMNHDLKLPKDENNTEIH